MLVVLAVRFLFTWPGFFPPFVGVLTVSISVCGCDSVLVHGCDVSQVLVFSYARESCPDVVGDFKFSVFWAVDVFALSD